MAVSPDLNGKWAVSPEDLKTMKESELMRSLREVLLKILEDKPYPRSKDFHNMFELLAAIAAAA